MKTIKKLMLLVELPVVMSCHALYLPTAASVSNQAYIGMSITEFKKLSRSEATVESMEAGYTVYKMEDVDLSTQRVLDAKYFYFDSLNKLYKIDSGEFRGNRFRH